MAAPKRTYAHKGVGGSVRGSGRVEVKRCSGMDEEEGTRASGVSGEVWVAESARRRRGASGEEEAEEDGREVDDGDVIVTSAVWAAGWAVWAV